MSYSIETYGEAIRQALAKAGEVRKQWTGEGASEIAEKLAALDRGERRRLFLELSAAAQPGVAEQLLVLSREQRGRNLVEAKRLARRAVECGLKAARHSPWPRIAADVCADALSELANLARIQGCFSTADLFFRRANLAMERGTGDKMLLVAHLRRQAALDRSQRRLKEASDLLRLALRVQAELHAPHEEGKLHFSLSLVHTVAGQTVEAFDEITLALEKLDPARDQLVYFRAVHTSILFMLDLGWHDLALSMADGCAPHYPKFGDDLLTLRGGWVRGRLHGLAGRPSVAERLLDETRRGFAARNLSYEAALATLDLAHLYARRRDMRKVAHLVREAYPVFVAKNIPREAAAALLFFADTAKKFGATAAVIEELVQKLHALRLH